MLDTGQWRTRYCNQDISSRFLYQPCYNDLGLDARYITEVLYASAYNSVTNEVDHNKADNDSYKRGGLEQIDSLDGFPHNKRNSHASKDHKGGDDEDRPNEEGAGLRIGSDPGSTLT
ncbi:uncharacterized protein BDR25DRAFT_361673 [Lindgomyces ingoldianus]|uniref:Uncharacterized protein n=1 Tax=Lindgomyces ingoldianus TaxID=673940 RepID=A0ACB6QC19_9PLEO|nr:uncharacterized protein BDR25DRAFT_361673 [Lindgomyces ingoldianus]KAF2464400.1 hypothetical protein BDR25DRAFT_361673 [Lindgomyces ingoldianus]